MSIPELYDRVEALEVIERSLADYEQRYGAPEARIEELRRLFRT